MRLFVAVRPPEDVLLRVEDLVAELWASDAPGRGTPGVRWEGREQWHVTLRFLGEVDDPASVVTLLERALGADGVTSVPARLGPTTELLGGRVLCVPTSGVDELGEAMAGVGWPPEGRRFRGHLTLARLPRGASRAVAARWVGHRIEVEWSVGEVELVRSHPRASGSRYETLARFHLRGMEGTG